MIKTKEQAFLLAKVKPLQRKLNASCTITSWGAQATIVVPDDVSGLHQLVNTDCQDYMEATVELRDNTPDIISISIFQAASPSFASARHWVTSGHIHVKTGEFENRDKDNQYMFTESLFSRAHEAGLVLKQLISVYKTLRQTMGKGDAMIAVNGELVDDQCRFAERLKQKGD